MSDSMKAVITMENEFLRIRIECLDDTGLEGDNDCVKMMDMVHHAMRGLGWHPDTIAESMHRIALEEGFCCDEKDGGR